MKKLRLLVFVLLATFSFGQTQPQSFTITVGSSAPVAIVTKTGATSITVTENSNACSANYTITDNNSPGQTFNIAACQSYVFIASPGTFTSGQTVGTIQATTGSGYSFTVTQLQVPVYKGVNLSGLGGSNLPTPASIGLCLVSTGTTKGAYAWSSCSGTASTAWANITAGTNAGQGNLLVGAGSTLNFTSTGVIDANQVNNATVPLSATILGTNSSRQLAAAALPSADIFVGNSSNLPVGVAISGDSTLTNAGVMTNVAVNGVSFPASPSTNTVPTVTGSNTITYEAVPNAALAHSSTTVNNSVCALGSTCTIPFQTNGTNNSSLSGLNLLTSTVNAVGLTVTPVNSATNAEKFEVTGSSYTGNAATATLASNSTEVGGITVTGTPSAGQVLTATSSSAADWASTSGNLVGSGLTANNILCGNGTVNVILCNGNGAVYSLGAITSNINPFAMSWENNNASVTFTGVGWTLADNASHSGSTVFYINGGVAGISPLFSLDNQGDLTILGQLTASQVNTNGPGAGTVALTQSTLSSLPVNSAGFSAPSSVPTAYTFCLNSAAPTGTSIFTVGAVTGGCSPVTYTAIPSIYTLQIAGTSLTAGNTVNFNASSPGPGANGINVTFQLGAVSSTDSVSAELVGDGTSTHYLSGLGTWTTPGNGVVGAVFSVNAGALTGITNDYLGTFKAPQALTVQNITGSAATLTCTTNPTMTFYDCGSSTTCSSPTTVGSVTVSAANTVTTGTINHASIASGDFIVGGITGGSCATLTGFGASMVY
jgi:hypothetical protein